MMHAASRLAIDLLGLVAVCFVVVTDPRNWDSDGFRLWFLRVDD